MVIEEPQMWQRSLEIVEVNAMWFMSLVPVDSKTWVATGLCAKPVGRCSTTVCDAWFTCHCKRLTLNRVA